MKVAYSWIKEYVGKNLPDPKAVEDLLTFHSFEVDEVLQVGDETVIDVDVLPNRASDCLSHRGIAREIAAVLGTELEYDPLRKELSATKTAEAVSVEIADKQACPRFTVSLLTGIEVKESPVWLQEKLSAIGQRSINNIVDATNYIMYALGQPMHAYDADKFPQVDGSWQFCVRYAAEGETVSLLAESGKDEDRTIELRGTELLIVDGSSDTPVGLAGIKGGRFAELHSGTKNILIEAAHFNPAVIRKTARGIGILTDASKRFENEPSRELPLYAQQEIIELIQKIAGGECEGVVDEYLEKYEPVTSRVRIERVNSLLGLSLTMEEVKKIIERIGAEVTEQSATELQVTAPWERTDLRTEVDYIEEVGRLHGLSNIESIAPEPVPLAEINTKQYYSEKIRQALISIGFSEVITSSFLKKGKIQLQNALASDKSYVRNTLVKNITAVLDANISHVDLLGVSEVRVFEIGTVFEKTETGIGERVMLTLGVRTKGDGYNPKDDALLEEGMKVVADNTKTNLEWKIEKGVAELDLSTLCEELETPKEYDPLPEKEKVTYKPFSQYPAMSRDIALWVTKEDQVEDVVREIVSQAGSLLVRHSLFDTFTKDGRTSYAFRLVFQAEDRTLTDAEINKIMNAVYEAVAQKGWEVR